MYAIVTAAKQSFVCTGVVVQPRWYIRSNVKCVSDMYECIYNC